MKQKEILVIICLVLCLLVPGVYANTVSITPANVQHPIGETQSFTVILDSAPGGLSGFNITLAVQNPAVAQIIGVSFNTTWASMPINSSVPASSIWCKAVDLVGDSGTVNITLVTILVRADSIGTTAITINPERVEDRIGGRYSPSVVPATLTCINVTNRPYNIGVFRPSSHMFYLKNGTTTTAISWGASTDLPVTGDWNGDGRTDVGVFRSSTHTFYLKNGTTTTSINWGVSTDLPVTGDWNGDSRTDVGVYRPSAHTFYLKNGTTTAINWGVSTDTPVTGDWNGDGRTEVGVFRNSTHTFYLKNGTTTTAISWGISTDIPVTGKW
jgi:hypothetical protein